MKRSVAKTALLMEMNLLLGPLSLVTLCAASMFAVMGFPHALGLFVAPLVRQDLETLTLVIALAPSALALREAWRLGLATLRRQPYRFGAAFWLAAGGSALGAALFSVSSSTVALYAMAPIWLFGAHMAALQSQLGRRR